MSPEALARLRAWEFDGQVADDFRALLAAYAAMEKERDEAMNATCDCDDDMTEDGHGRACTNGITARLATARAEGVAAERARVVADLRAEVKALREMKFCACGCEMPLAEALKERKNGYLNDEQAESLMSVRIGGARTNAEAARLERAADRYERGEHDEEGER